MVSAFVVLADTLVSGLEVADFLHRVIDRALGLLDADAAGIMLADSSGQLQVVASSNDLMEVLELLELEASPVRAWMPSTPASR